MTTCTRTDCEATAPAQLYLCRTHVDDLGRLIGSCEGLLDDAAETIAKQGGNGSSGGGGNASVSSAPINLTAMERRDILASVLVAAGVDDRRRDPARRAWDLAKSGRAGEWAEVIHDEAKRLSAVIDRPVEWRVLGKCGVPFCQSHYRYQEGDTIAVCRNSRCRATMDIAKYRTWQLQSARSVPAHLSKLVLALRAAGLPVSVNTAKSWVRRGHLHPVGRDEQGRDLYVAEDIIDRLGVAA